VARVLLLVAAMKHNVPAEQHVPRIAAAIAAGIGAALVPGPWLKTGLYAAAAGLLGSVATGYCPVTAAWRGIDTGREEPGWRTLKTYRVDA
jgi:hypothetical protein